MQQFNWAVLSQDEILKQQNNLEPGEYQFEVTSATFKISQNGNHMVNLVLKIWGNDGMERTCRDNLIGTPGWAFKSKKFWESVGHPEIYEKGGCSEHDFVGKQGTVKTKLEKSDDGERMYINVVAYTVKKKAENNSNNVGSMPEENLGLDDDIPF